MALQPFLGPWTLFQFPWTGDQPVARPLPTHRTTQTQNKRIQYRHPCLNWDSTPRSQRSSKRRQFMPQTVRPMWSAILVYRINIRNSSPGGSKNFTSPCRQDRLWGPPYPMGNGGKAAGAWSWALTLQLVPRSRKRGSIPPLHHTSSWRSA
jgi:hypothetical protein